MTDRLPTLGEHNRARRGDHGPAEVRSDCCGEQMHYSSDMDADQARREVQCPWCGAYGWKNVR